MLFSPGLPIMKKIMLIEDDRDILDVVELILASHSYDLQFFSGVNGVVDAVVSMQPHLILLDLHLSGVDGQSLCKTFKESKTTSHIPVILFSALSGLPKISEECGADGYIEKPFDMNNFVAIVEKHLQ